MENFLADLLSKGGLSGMGLIVGRWVTVTPEQVLDKEIMLYCGSRNAICFHTNVGKIKFFDSKVGKERWFDTGLPKGWPDLLILTDNGKTFFCETKIHPRKPTIEQLNIIRNLTERGHLAFVCYSLDEFKEKTKNIL